MGCCQHSDPHRHSRHYHRKRKHDTIYEKQLKDKLNLIFDKYDDNKDGKLNREEVYHMIKEIGQHEEERELTKAEVEENVKLFYIQADDNGNGMITKQEFYKFYKLS